MSKTVPRLGLNNAGDGRGLSPLVKGISPHSITHLKVLLDSLENTYKIAVHLQFLNPLYFLLKPFFNQSTYLLQMVETEKADPNSQSAESIQHRGFSHNLFVLIAPSERSGNLRR